MAKTKPQKSSKYLFVIDTDKYAGNFERELCAYITGQIGECGVGEEQAEIARKEAPNLVKKLEYLVEQVQDENGCYRPVAIFPNPQYGNDGKGNHEKLNETNKKKFRYPAYNSVAINFYSKPDRDLIEIMKERAQKICKEGIGLNGLKQKVQIEGFRLIEKNTTYQELEL